jgi:argininosuccinate lyase
MSQIWNTNNAAINPKVLEFTAGEDKEFDQKVFLPYDIQASKAHVKMLESIELLTKEEAAKLIEGLNKIQTLWDKGEFQIKEDEEDGHTAIEAYLTEHYGETGKKIHTARSRNDQSLVMIRLYEKEQLVQIKTLIQSLIQTWANWSKEHGSLDMPGYSHLQKAMPTTLGTWMGSYQNALEDTLILLEAQAKIIDQNPLGSAAGFGVPMEINKELTTKELGFSRTQDNPMYCQFSRGWFESMLLTSLTQVHTVLSRWASDMLLFTTKEFNFFQIDPAFVTSSSIMPQKKNQDVFELMRGRLAIQEGAQAEMQSIVGRLFSGYQRDLQLIKAPLIRSIQTLQSSLEMAALVTSGIKPNTQALTDSMSEDLYATHKVYELVKQGIPFREAYAQVKKTL